jgi:hypothetical protein
MLPQTRGQTGCARHPFSDEKYFQRSSHGSVKAQIDLFTIGIPSLTPHQEMMMNLHASGGRPSSPADSCDRSVEPSMSVIPMQTQKIRTVESLIVATSSDYFIFFQTASPESFFRDHPSHGQKTRRCIEVGKWDNDITSRSHRVNSWLLI